MSKKKLTPYLLIGGTLLLLVLAELLIPKPLDWTVTLSSEDKNPYGAYALWKVLPDLFPEQELHNLHQTIYESDSLPVQASYLILAQNFMPDQADSRALLEKAAAGASIFIAAQDFGGSFADTLALSTGNHLFEQMAETDNFGTAQDSVYIRYLTPAAPAEHFGYTLPALPAYFDSLPALHEIVAVDQQERPVLIRRSWGKGSLCLSTTPLAFTNYYLLEGRNHRFIEQALSQLPPAPLYWTEFYQVGRLESGSPLRFVLGHNSLRWAYYFGMIVLLLFILFGLKRRQRVIPIIESPENSSLRFAHSIGTLYYQQGDHLNLARKQLLYFKEYIRSHYRLPVDWNDKSFGEKLAKKSGKEEEEIAGLMKQAQQVETAQTYTAKKLQQLHHSIQGFYEHGRK
jgi:hypothetical protein